MWIFWKIQVCTTTRLKQRKGSSQINSKFSDLLLIFIFFLYIYTKTTLERDRCKIKKMFYFLLSVKATPSFQRCHFSEHMLCPHSCTPLRPISLNFVASSLKRSRQRHGLENLMKFSNFIHYCPKTLLSSVL